MESIKKPSFQTAFISEIGRALSNNGVVVLEAATLSSGNEKAQEWAQALASGLISYETKLKDEHSFLTIKSEPYGQILFEIKNDHRCIHKFMVRIVQKAHQVKCLAWPVSKSFIFNPRNPTQFDEISRKINSEWTEQLQTLGADWAQYPMETINEWRKGVFDAFLENIGDKTTEQHFLDTILGKEDTYWVAKKPRSPALVVAPVNRSGRLRMGEEYLKPLSIEEPPEILSTNGELYLEVPLNNHMTLRCFVDSYFEKSGIGVKTTWFLFGKAEHTLSL